MGTGPEITACTADVTTDALNQMNDSVCYKQFAARPTKSKYIYSDRFIPSRASTNLDALAPLSDEEDDAYRPTQRPINPNNSTSRPSDGNNEQQREESPGSFTKLLKRELLGLPSPSRPCRISWKCSEERSPIQSSRSRQGSILRFKMERPGSNARLTHTPLFGSTLYSSKRYLTNTSTPARRRIAKTPFKVLDAPTLQDDFYLNLVDWSPSNKLAVGLGSSVYLWSACTSKADKLLDLSEHANSVSSVCWNSRGTHLAVGTNNGQLQIWDAGAEKLVRTMHGHAGRVGSSTWSSHLLASGSRDRSILARDVRAREPFEHRLTGHKQEVCGLKWSFDNLHLASGGNDNKLCVWSALKLSSSPSNNPVGARRECISEPLFRFSDHTAAVKAIAWSPHQHGLLASGGGTADRCIRFWNMNTGQNASNNTMEPATGRRSIDTGSQVCNLMWSKNVNELVSTHGYSLNQIFIWDYPSMRKVATLTGHTCRVLYLAMSPDGQTIVTGAGDETLRFWNAFPSSGVKGSSRFGSALVLPLGPGNVIR